MANIKHFPDLQRKGALQLRQEFGLILSQMEQGADPLIIERNSSPVAVLLPYSLFMKRFVEHQSQGERNELLERFKSAQKKSKKSSLEILRELRYGEK